MEAACISPVHDASTNFASNACKIGIEGTIFHAGRETRLFWIGYWGSSGGMIERLSMPCYKIDIIKSGNVNFRAFFAKIGKMARM